MMLHIFKLELISAPPWKTRNVTWICVAAVTIESWQVVLTGKLPTWRMTPWQQPKSRHWGGGCSTGRPAVAMALAQRQAPWPGPEARVPVRRTPSQAPHWQAGPTESDLGPVARRRDSELSTWQVPTVRLAELRVRLSWCLAAQRRAAGPGPRLAINLETPTYQPIRANSQQHAAPRAGALATGKSRPVSQEI